MAFNGSRIDANQIGAARDQYDTLTKGRGTAAGITNDGSYTDPFDKNHDGSYSVNAWTHADNQNPHRGNVTFKNYKGENETVPFWQADRAFSANLGLTGFSDISNQLKELQSSFSSNLQNQSNLNFANLSEQTGKDYFTLNKKGRLVRS